MSQPTVLFDVPGPKGRARNVVITAVGWVIIAGALVALAWGLRSELTAVKIKPFGQGDTWRFYLLPGLLNTLQAAVTAVITSVLLGFLLGCGRMSTWRWLNLVCGVFVEFFRSVPVLLMMIFAWYFFLYVIVLPGSFPAFAGVVVGLTLYNSAVIAELIRSGVFSLPRGQGEAGLAVGMTPGQVLTTIQLPQAVTAMLPSLVSQLVVILKDTALGTAITYSELLKQGNDLATNKGNLVATFILLAVFFILINASLTAVARALERRLRRSAKGPRRAVVAPLEPGLGGTSSVV
ncbi:MAG: amino acid ABC transporter permease [Propionibacteriaceae bacterium]